MEMGVHLHGFHYRYSEERERQHYSIMVMIDKLSKVAHFIRVKNTCSTDEVAHVFIREIVRLLGVPRKIVLDRDAKFTSKICKE